LADLVETEAQPGSNVEILLAGPMGNHSGKIINGD